MIYPLLNVSTPNVKKMAAWQNIIQTVEGRNGLLGIRVIRIMFFYYDVQHCLMKDKKKILFWSLLLIILVLLTILFAVRTIHRYETWKEHSEYLKSGNKTIEDWMTVNLIVNRSGIPKELVYNELRIKESFTNDRKHLSKLCQENNLNCTEVVARLNRLSGERGT